MTSDGGKGDTPRPIPDYKEYEKNWDIIFGRDKQQEPKQEKKDESKD
jgi:hypothetical protein